MTQSTQQMIDELRSMTVRELRDRYAAVFDEPTRSGNRQWLVRRIAWRVQALAEGDLSDRARQRAAELARDADIRLRPPDRPRVVSKRVTADDRLPLPGSVLTRSYKGIEYRVTVLQEGFEHDGAIYRSLSAVAVAITGSHWNGFHFFGLNQRKDPT